MKHAIDAIYENGVFRPIQRPVVTLPEGGRVTITIDDGSDSPALRLAMSVYDGLSADELSQIEAIVLNRGTFFGPRSDG